MPRICLSLVILCMLATSALAQGTAEPDPSIPLPVELAAELAALDERPAYLQDADVTAAAYLAQPGLVVPAEAPSAESPRPVRRSSRSEYVRLARVPNMLGDSLSTGGQFVVGDTTGQTKFISDVPLGFARSVKIGENNKGLPMDRVYFIYNGFQNALQRDNGAGQIVDANVDRYTLGGEKTFWDGLASLDVRMPFIGSFASPEDAQGAISTGNVGDVSLFFKGLLYADNFVSVAAGVGTTVPSASAVEGQIQGAPFRIDNRAVHVLPYFGVVLSPDDAWFFQAFVQCDFAASGYRIQQGGQSGPVLTEQNFLYVDALAGRYLYQNESAPYLTGIAGLVELHYISALNNADLVQLELGNSVGTLGNIYNRVDYLNLTGGVQFDIGQLANLRVSCVVPLKTDTADRQFDSEVLVSFNRYF
ncbi:MAG: hypothetical protein SFU86_12675 [Pirellulaceae bacterium]|nr:hypothetical protein [Pirellulaceae bacterium]